jgi:hypothetical protein
MSESVYADVDITHANGNFEFIIAGDSHIFAMGADHGYLGPAALAPVRCGDCSGYFLMEQWSGARQDSYWEALAVHAAGRVAVLSFMGNAHFGNFLLASTPLFDFVDPDDTGFQTYPGAVLVPRRLVKALPAFNPNSLRGLINHLRARGCHNILVLGTPPVREDFVTCMEEVRAQPGWRQVASSMGVDIVTCPCTPAPIMKRLWGVLQQCLSDAAAASDAEFLPAPQEAVNADGYLRVEYRGPLSDFAHANNAYGRLVLENVAQAVRRVG